MNNQNSKRVIFSLLLIPVAVLFLIPFVKTIKMSTVDYKPIYGLWSSPSVGIAHYKDFLSSIYIGRLFSNTLAFSVVALMVGSVYTFFATVAVNSAGNRYLKFLLTFIFCSPAFLPGILIANTLLPIVKTATGSGDVNCLRFLIGVSDGLRLSSFLVFASSFSEGNTWNAGIKYTLIFAALRIITIFTTDAGMINLLYNPAIYEKMDTLNTFVFRSGIASADYSYSSAVDVIRVLCQMIPAAVACVLLIIADKNKEVPISEAVPTGISMSVAAILPIGILLAVLVTGSSLFPESVGARVLTGYSNEFVIAIMSAFLVTGVSYVISLICCNADSIASSVFLTFAVLVSGCLLTDYLNIREIGLINTLLGSAVMNMGIVPVFAVAFTYILKNVSGVKKHLSLLISGFSFSFAWFWGEMLAPSIILNDGSTLPLSLLIKNAAIINEGNFVPQPFSSVIYILIPLVICFGGILIGQILLKKEETPVQNTDAQADYSNFS